MSKAKDLQEYIHKRRFNETPEPIGKQIKSNHDPIFVVQEHHASHLHWDFRLEIEGVLRSWAIPKGPSTDPADRRLAVLTEDHPMEYATFQGTIPVGNYGAGTVKIWDSGTYKNMKPDPIDKCFDNGDIIVNLLGKKLKGSFALIKTKLNTKNSWIFLKMKNDL